MRASEWQFLCAVHEQPKSCCAIDYCCHTLDWAANVVSDQKLFPSRFAVLTDPHSKSVGVKNLVNVFRRLHRMFAHAWFQHRSVFWTVESQTGLYVFFKTVCDLYDLLPAENYKLPPEAEGLEAPSAETETPDRPTPSILKPPAQQQGLGADEDGPHSGGRTNTRRHIRSSPSTGSAVTTVMESEEEETDGVSGKMQNLQISGPPSGEQDPEVADVPVIVDRSTVAHTPTATAAASGEPSVTVESIPAESSSEVGDVTVVETESTPVEKTPETKVDEAVRASSDATVDADQAQETETLVSDDGAKEKEGEASEPPVPDPE